MRTVNQWFEEYSLSHQHSGNKLIHYICVPLITYSTLGIIDALSRPNYLNLPISLAFIVIAFCGLFYLRLSYKLGLLMSFINSLNGPVF